MREFLSKILEIIDDGTTDIIITKDLLSDTPRIILDDRFKLYRSEMHLSDKYTFYTSDVPIESFNTILNDLWEKHKEKKTTLREVYSPQKSDNFKFIIRGEENE